MNNDCCPKTPALVHDPCPVMPARVRGTNAAQLCFPGFCFTNEHGVGASYVVYQFYLTGLDGYIALQPLLAYQTDDYILGVSDMGRHFYFWEVSGATPLGTLYAGEPLSQDAIFQVWTTPTVFSVEVEAFCVPINYVSDCAGTKQTYQLSGRKKLWQRFRADTYEGAGDELGNVYMKFCEEKEC